MTERNKKEPKTDCSLLEATHRRPGWSSDLCDVEDTLCNIIEQLQTEDIMITLGHFSICRDMQKAASLHSYHYDHTVVCWSASILTLHSIKCHFVCVCVHHVD